MNGYAYGYKKPGDGTVWLECAACKRPFRVYRYRQREGAKFCSIFCSEASQRAYTRALVEGKLDGLLSQELAKAKAEVAERMRTRRSIDWRRAAKKGIETTYERQVRELGRPLEG